MSQPRPGRLPARVYWVRRFVVLGIPLLLVVLVVWLVAGRGSSGDTPAAASQQTTTPVKPTPSDTPTGVPPNCAADHLGLALAATAESFPAGVSPVFAVTITNTGSEPCLVDAGEAQREIVITSGDDRVWSTRDCVAAGTETRTLLLTPGEGGADAQQLTWNRIRSAAGCPDGLPAPGPGTYSATFSLAGATAPPVVFGLG